MTYVWVLAFTVVVWALMAAAATVQAALFARRQGEEPQGVSVIAYLVPPPVLTGLAYVVDHARPNMGTWVVVGVHTLLGILATAQVLRGRAILRRES